MRSASRVAIPTPRPRISIRSLSTTSTHRESMLKGSSEDATFEQEVKHVKSWWATPRWAGIKRPYTADQVVNKRGALQQTYPSSSMATKLFHLLQKRAAVGGPVHTSTSDTSPSSGSLGVQILIVRQSGYRTTSIEVSNDLPNYSI